MSSVRLLLAFSEAARQCSFAAAARELGVSPSAVAKSVERLERQLRLRLFQRTTRRVTLTEEGEALFARCRRVLDELDALESQAADAAREPAGTLRLNVPIAYGKRVVVPVLAALVGRHPGLRIDLRLSDQFVDLIGGGLDAVVRVGTIGDSRLVARAFDRQTLGVYASPSYLAHRGRPRQPSGIMRHSCIAFRRPTSGTNRPWEFTVDGEPLALHPVADHTADDGEGMVRLAECGLGLIQVPDYMAIDAVRAGRLAEVLSPFSPRSLPISLVFPTNRHVPPRMRVLIEALDGVRQASAGDVVKPAKPSRRPGHGGGVDSAG